MWGRVARQDDTESPGSDGASPYLPALPPRGLAYDITPYAELARPTDKGIHCGVALQGRMTRKAPVRTEPHPTFRRCLRVAASMTSPRIELAGQTDKDFIRGRVANQDDTESPGSDGASPYLPQDGQRSVLFPPAIENLLEPAGTIGVSSSR